jgi:hypothetical protein
MAKYVKNNSGVNKTWVGQLVLDDQYYELQPIEIPLWANNSQLLIDIANGDAIVAKDNSGSSDITDVASAISFLKDEIKEVVTQFEKNDKITKLARSKAEVNPSTKKATILIKVPGIAGSGDGRFISGGFAISEDYDKDDYATAKIKDEDRILAWQVALSQNPSATAPVSDATMIAIGSLPGIQSLASYPYIGSYTEEELTSENEGWYFWPLAQGNNTVPCGETEVESLGGYGFLPSGLYLEIAYHRNTLTTGSLRVNLEWGKVE